MDQERDRERNEVIDRDARDVDYRGGGAQPAHGLAVAIISWIEAAA